MAPRMGTLLAATIVEATGAVMQCRLVSVCEVSL